ncbi:sodium/hydrogen exchanger 9B1-like [Phymastichus coffea]|uniref:sodium/hydrogen exchanger 9B1-like n=1 Tax=Phymastichus coffea TaxID=108790 RepID=UPI00273B20CE|nr:sodium/hydrogen exchanger 9B1-like [Phymastichus coffea]
MQSRSAQTLAEQDEDLTCCGRATCCHGRLRDVNVTEPLIGWCCDQFTYETLFWLVTVTLMLSMCGTILYYYVGEPMLPGGNLFGLLATLVFAYFLGWTLAYVPFLKLPPVFGMLLAGIIVRNAGWYDIHEQLGPRVSSKLRTFSVTFVMLRAGLQFSWLALREHPLFVLNLAVVPCSMELAAVALLCRGLLGYPLVWALLAGSIIACVSPVVPINCMLALAERGYGEDKEISTLLFAAASLDDVHIVSVYSICFSFVFSDGELPRQWWSYISGGLRDLLLGTTVGAAFGLLFVFLPHRRHRYVLWYRVCGLVLGSLMCTTAMTKVLKTGGGFLATIVMSLVATMGWRVLSVPFDVRPMRRAVHIMWHLMQPVLVGVIGAEIDFRDWSLARFGLYVVCISGGLLVRTIFAYLATFHTPFNSKERLFIALAWISKGTLQAALAPMTYEQAKLNDDERELQLAEDVVKMSAVSILFLAPLGAIVMMLTGPRLLNQTSLEEHRRRRELSRIKLLSLQPVQRT